MYKIDNKFKINKRDSLNYCFEHILYSLLIGIELGMSGKLCRREHRAASK